MAELLIGELPSRALGEAILIALEAEGIKGRLVASETGTGVQILAPPENAELAREILAFLKTEIRNPRRG